MPAKLIITRGTSLGQEEMLTANTVVIGRSEMCQIVVRDDQVSRRHAELSSQAGQWYVRDLDSVNGTFVNDRRLRPGESIPLQPGGRLRLGANAEFMFRESPVTKASSFPDLLPAAEAPLDRPRPNPLYIGLAAASLILLAVLVFLAWRNLTGDKATPTTAGVTTKAGTGSRLADVATALPAIVTAELPKELALPTVGVPTITLPSVDLGGVQQPAAPKVPAASIPAGAGAGAVLPGSFLPEQLPALIASAFPGVPVEQLPAAIEQAIRSGQVTPDAAQEFINALFPGIAPAQLPTALAGSFAGFSQAQIQGILDALFPGQTLPLPQFSSQEGQVVFAALDAGGQRLDIYQMNADGSGKKVLIENASEPAFSPDGNRLAYASWRSDAVGLHIRDMRTGEDKQLTGNSNDAYPSWSPDGSQIVFWDITDDSILTIRADGSDRRPVTRGQFPAWSPRGDRIALKGCIGGDCGIVLVNPDGSNPIRLTTNANDGQPAWSPDGRNIAFVSNRDGNWEIYAVNSDGSWLRRITNDIHTDGLPAWASDGIRIAFRSDRSGQWAIYTATGIGGPPFKLTDAPVATSGRWQWTWEKLTWR